MGVYIQDAEFASLYQSPPNLRHLGNRHEYACPNEVFDAPDALAWARAMKQNPSQPCTIRQYFSNRSLSVMLGEQSNPSMVPKVVGISDPKDGFTLYVILEGIGAQVSEARELDQQFNYVTQNEIATLLLAWQHSYKNFCQENNMMEASPFCLMILWHSIFVSLFADINEIEIAFGRQGSKSAESIVPKIASWASSSNAKRAVLHVNCIRQLLSQLPLSCVPEIHVPRVTFQSALVVWTYIRFNDAGSTLGASSAAWTEMPTWREFSVLGLDPRALQRDLYHVRDGWGADQALGPFSEILHRLGYWGLAEKLGSILDVGIIGEINLGM
jgi:hypothetical protein